MLWIQLVLIVGFLAALIRFLSSSSHKVKAWKKILGLLFTVIAVGFILFPDSSNRVAHWVGVTRGADLLLYFLVLAFIFVCINLYTKSLADERELVQLVRRVAILEANQRYQR